MLSGTRIAKLQYAVYGVREVNDADVSATSYARTLRRSLAPVNMTRSAAVRDNEIPVDAYGKWSDAMERMKQRAGLR